MANRTPEINGRQRSIICALLNANRKVTLRELSEETGLSTRAVRYNMDIVRSWMQIHDLVFINRPGYGCEVVASQEKKIELIQELGALKDCDIILTRQQRIRIILFYLLTHTEPIAARHVSEIETFSRSTFFKDISEIETWLDKYQIRLVRKSSRGLWVEGSETSRRFALARLLRRELGEKHWFILPKYIQDGQHPYDEHISNVFCQFLNQLELRFSRKLIQYIEENIGLPLSPFSQSEIMVYLAIAIQAVSQGLVIQGEVDEQIRSGEEYGIAQMICYQIQKQFNCNFNDKEKEIIAALVMSSKLDNIPLDSNHQTDHLLQASANGLRIAQELINICSMRLHPMIKIDEILLNELATHLDYAFFRLRHHIPIRNAYLDVLRERYTQIYRVVETSVFIIENEIGLPVPPEEIGFIVMYLLAALERLRTEEDSRLTAIIINDGVRSKSSLLKARLEFEFPNIKIVKVINTYDADRDVDVEAELIISTLPIEQTGLPVIQVSPFLELDEIKSIQRWMADKSHSKQRRNLHGFDQQNSLVDLIKLPHIIFANEAADWHSIVHKASQPLIQSGCIQPRYVSAMMEVIEQYGFYMYMGVGVLLLHAKPTDGVNQLCISLLRLNKPFHFEDNRIPDIDLIFVLGATDDNSHLTALFQLNELIQFPLFMDAVRSAKQPTDIIHTLWQWLPKLPESV